MSAMRMMPVGGLVDRAPRWDPSLVLRSGWEGSPHAAF